MAAKNWLPLFQFIFLILSVICSATNVDRKAHIVYMGSLKNMEFSRTSHHLNLLESVIDGSSSATGSYIRSYGRSFNGFVAYLTDSEREKLATMDGVVSVFPSEKFQTHTTRSWDFVGFTQQIKRNNPLERDVIIGSFDTGIWPESESFKDDGLGPPPKRWKGVCNGGANFTCNNKIIGARYYSASSSALDSNGHGSHTASIAAGNAVSNASFYGIASGVARGGVPSARIATYKVCESGCGTMDILAAFDDAIADGVDLITISIGSPGVAFFKFDPIAIGSFHAMERGILTVQSAGNNGPLESSVESVAPWVFSIGATTTDRYIMDKIVLGNGKTVIGKSVNSFTPNQEMLPLIYGANASTTCSSLLSEICTKSCLDPNLVKGKIVQCMASDGAAEALRAGAQGTIVLNDRIGNVSLVVALPESAVIMADYDVISEYATTDKNPLAKILKSEAIVDNTAPNLARFSARGPNRMIPEIMKPDITAPGVEILAAFPPTTSPSFVGGDKRSVKFSILSGTSMSCPHVAGVAAYVKSFHPDWSPSAIKSAIMTTAVHINNTDNFTIGEFLYGSGQINPKQSINPGLVYETFKDDYVDLLCGLGFDTKDLRLITGDKSTCPKNSTKLQPKDLNYPAMIVQVMAMESAVVTIQRRVTNVGVANSNYTATILPFSKVFLSESPEKPQIQVNPSVISFESMNEKKDFTVKVTVGEIPAETVFSTALVWNDGIHNVRSPIVVKVLSRPSSMNVRRID